MFQKILSINYHLTFFQVIPELPKDKRKSHFLKCQRALINGNLKEKILQIISDRESSENENFNHDLSTKGMNSECRIINERMSD